MLEWIMHEFPSVNMDCIDIICRIHWQYYLETNHISISIRASKTDTGLSVGMNTSQIMRIISFLFNLTFIFCQEFREKNYHIINGLKISQTYRTLSGIVSTTRCAMQCLEVNYCTSANYNGAANQCELTQHSPEDGSVNIIEDQTWKIIFIKNRKYNLF